MSEEVILLGGGGHGRVVLDALLASGVRVVGILDSKFSNGDRVFGVPVLGGDEFLENLAISDVLLVNGVGANPSTRRRRSLFEGMKNRGFRFDVVKHPSAEIGRECEICEGAEIMVGAVLQSRVRVGENAVVNTRASVDHDCVLGAHSFISPGAVLCGEVTVAEAVFIGAGATVMPGIRLGVNAMVGAGAVVVKSVPDGWIVVGNPAIKIGINE